MERCVIVGGADINNIEFVKSHLKDNDFIVACDRGLYNCDLLNITPNLIVGDFDSYENPNLSTETIVLPCEKDDTDTFYAVKEAVKRGFEDFLLLGVFGNRLDHTFGNISVLMMLDSKGLKAVAADDTSLISIISKNPSYVKDDCRFFSVIAIGGSASGIYERNSKYLLENATVNPEYQFGISNEVLPGQTAEICVSKGRLLLIVTY